MYRIKFSPADKTITGEDLVVAQEKHYQLWRGDLEVKAQDPNTVNQITHQKAKEDVVSIRDQEKSYLKSLCYIAGQMSKSQISYMDMQVVFKKILDADDYFDLDEGNLRRLQAAIEKSPESRPAYTLYLVELFKQLKNPEKLES